MANQEAIGPQVTNNNWWEPSKVVKRTTETLEYDEKGNLVKRTIVTEETTVPPYGTRPYVWNTGLGVSFFRDSVDYNQSID
jgi:hypothetical protein